MESSSSLWRRRDQGMGTKGEQAGKVRAGFPVEHMKRSGSGPRLFVTTPRFPIETQVVRVSPDIHWSYAVVERVDSKTLTTRLLPFDLGAAILGSDEKANIALEPGDVITIFSDADIRVPRAQQTKYVPLEGGFSTPVQRATPANVKQLVMRAGGLTEQAYLYGSQFSRRGAKARAATAAWHGFVQRWRRILRFQHRIKQRRW